MGIFDEWTPFERATHVQTNMESVAAGLVTGVLDDEIWINNRYQVNIRRYGDEGEPQIVHLSIKARNKDAIHDWRDMQRIKNELVGSECEGVELYPAESRLVDTANQYHVFVVADPRYRFPFGFNARLVAEGSAFGVRQRPWARSQRPEDCIDTDTPEGRATLLRSAAKQSE